MTNQINNTNVETTANNTVKENNTMDTQTSVKRSGRGKFSTPVWKNLVTVPSEPMAYVKYELMVKQIETILDIDNEVMSASNLYDTFLADFLHFWNLTNVSTNGVKIHGQMVDIYTWQNTNGEQVADADNKQVVFATVNDVTENFDAAIEKLRSVMKASKDEMDAYTADNVCKTYKDMNSPQALFNALEKKKGIAKQTTKEELPYSLRVFVNKSNGQLNMRLLRDDLQKAIADYTEHLVKTAM